MYLFQEEQERIGKQKAELQKLKNEIRPAFAIKGKRKVTLRLTCEPSMVPSMGKSLGGEGAPI